MWLLLLFFVPTVFTGACVADYSDIQALGVACSPRDTCSSNTVRRRTFFTSNCECDSWCHSFDDCCVDAPSASSRNRIYRSEGVSCVNSEDQQGAYAIRSCKSSWNGSSVVRRKCENDDGNFSDPLMYVPTTDTYTNVTYQNHFCAECNYGNLNNLSLWEVTVSCSSLENLDSVYHNITVDFITQNITRFGGSWGVYHWNDSLKNISFYPCEVSYRLPHTLKQHVRLCRPDVISTCAGDWTRYSVRRKCSEYMAVIYINDQAYRNAHCALCNRVSIGNFSCDSMGVTRRTKPSMSFSLLLDVNQSDGENVGETNSCPSGQTWDPFAKRCRNLTCALPGHVYSDMERKCVPQ